MRSISLFPVLCSLQAVTAGILSRQLPHLIIPVNTNSPNTPAGTKFEGNVQQIVSLHIFSLHSLFPLTPDQTYTEVLFDVPSNGATWCQLDFDIYVDASGAHSEGAPWHVWDANPFKFNISSLDRTINKDTDTWFNRPNTVDVVAHIEVFSNGKVVVHGGGVPCLKGQPNSFLLYPADNQIGGLTWFELDNPLHGISYIMNE
jgi:hypothetical protein